MYFLVPMTQQSLLGHLINEASQSHSTHHTRWGFLRTSDQPDAQTSAWQHTTLPSDIQASGRIRTSNYSKRAAAAQPLRPCLYTRIVISHRLDQLTKSSKRVTNVFLRSHRWSVSLSLRKTFPASSLKMVSKNLVLTSTYWGEPDSKQIGKAAITTLPAVCGTASVKSNAELSANIMSMYSRWLDLYSRREHKRRIWKPRRDEFSRGSTCVLKRLLK